MGFHKVYEYDDGPLVRWCDGRQNRGGIELSRKHKVLKGMEEGEDVEV